MAKNKPVYLYKYKITTPESKGNTITVNLLGFDFIDVQNYLATRTSYSIEEREQVCKVDLMTRDVARMITENAIESMGLVAVQKEKQNKKDVSVEVNESKKSMTEKRPEQKSPMKKSN